MSAPELSRTVRLDLLGQAPRSVEVTADASEREALARRFDLVAIDHLTATVQLTRAGEEVRASGQLSAQVTQSCVATGEPVDARVTEDFTLLFRPQPEVATADEEIELGEGEMDVIFYDGASVDVGEAVAETLSLSLDPYPRAADADTALRDAGVKGEEEAKRQSSPFAALGALKGSKAE